MAKAKIKSRAQIKAAGGKTRLAKETTRPGTKATPQERKRRPQQKITFKKGAGTAFGAPSIKKRHQQFLRQQRENKVIAWSIVGRGAQTGPLNFRKRDPRFKRGVKVAATRLKQFAEIGELEVVTNAKGQRMEKRVTSSWVEMIHLVIWQGQPALAITFRAQKKRGKFIALYPTTNIRDYEIMSASASKGKYIWAALYHGVPRAGAPYFSIGFR